MSSQGKSRVRPLSVDTGARNPPMMSRRQSFIGTMGSSIGNTLYSFMPSSPTDRGTTDSWRKRRFDGMMHDFHRRYVATHSSDSKGLAHAVYEDALRRYDEQKTKFNDKAATLATLHLLRQRVAVPWFMIIPGTKRAQRWDSVTGVALIITAIFTPFEVALLPLRIDFTFCLNRLIDLIFISDMILAFVTAYKLPKHQGGGLVKDLRKIRKKYFQGWFWIDAVAIIPFDLIDMLSSGSNMSFLSILRTFRILRLLRLLRMAKASRIYQEIASSVSLRQSTIGLAKYTCMLIVVSHWMACLWILLGKMQSNDVWTWLDELAMKLNCGNPAVGDDCGTKHPPRENLLVLETYFAALYWSIITITSVGYGDIVAQNSNEMIILVLFILIGSSFWAFILGNACSILSTMDPESIEHKQLLDAFNDFMADKGFPKELCKRLRSYINNCKELNKSNHYQELMLQLSPQLRGDVMLCNANWLAKVYYFKGASVPFIIEVASAVVGSVYEPSERIEWADALFCVDRGVASRQGRVKTHGGCWGEDMILSSRFLKNTSPAFALTYVEVLVLSREDLYRIASDYETEAKVIRKAATRLAAKKGILHITRTVRSRSLNHSVTMEEALTHMLDEAQIARDDHGHDHTAVHKAMTGMHSKRNLFERLKTVVDESTERVCHEIAANAASTHTAAAGNSVERDMNDVKLRVERLESEVTTQLDNMTRLLRTMRVEIKTGGSIGNGVQAQASMSGISEMSSGLLVDEH